MRRIDFLKIKRGDNLGDPEFWNRRLEDIDLRIANNEDALQNVDAVANRVEALALDRMNNMLVPLTEEAFNRLTSVATLFGATSSTAADIAVGTKSFIIDQGKRNTFAPLLFIVVFPAGDTSRYMAGRTVSYDVATGTLVVDVSRVVGDGSASTWEIAPIASVDEIEGYANSAADDALATAADRLAVSTDKGTVAGDRSAAQTARTDAQIARDKAQKWADEAEDTAVEAGKYSAKHHAAKAAASASAAALDAASVSPSNLLHKADNLSDVADADTALGNLGATTVGKAVFKAADQAAGCSALGLGSAATKDAGTGANNLVQLDANAKLPAVDGSNLTNLDIPTPPAHNDRVTNVRLAYAGSMSVSSYYEEPYTGAVCSGATIGSFYLPDVGYGSTPINYFTALKLRYLQAYTPASGWFTASYT